MVEIIYLQEPSEWADVTLAKRQLAWSKKQKQLMRNDDRFDFDESIAKEENIIRSFFDSLKDRSLAA